MSTDIIHIGVECGIAVLFLIAVTFVLNQVGLLTWIWWASRRKRPSLDSAARRYREIHR